MRGPLPALVSGPGLRQRRLRGRRPRPPVEAPGARPALSCRPDQDSAARLPAGRFCAEHCVPERPRHRYPPVRGLPDVSQCALFINAVLCGDTRSQSPIPCPCSNCLVRFPPGATARLRSRLRQPSLGRRAEGPLWPPCTTRLENIGSSRSIPPRPGGNTTSTACSSSTRSRSSTRADVSRSSHRVPSWTRNGRRGSGLSWRPGQDCASSWISTLSANCSFTR